MPPPFPQSWSAEILERPPLIAPATHHIYPQSLTEDEGAREDATAGALILQIKPAEGPSFLATFARGFAEPTLPHGVWPCPHPDWLCAAAGGYVYLIETTRPTRWHQISYRPVVEIRPLDQQKLLLFTSFRQLLAWGPKGIAWESPKLSDEGLRITNITANELHGLGWDLLTDKEIPFTVDLLTGQRIL